MLLLQLKTLQNTEKELIKVANEFKETVNDSTFIKYNNGTWSQEYVRKDAFVSGNERFVIQCSQQQLVLFSVHI